MKGKTVTEAAEREFDLESILTITNRNLVVGCNYVRILEFLLGTFVYAKDEPRAKQICKPWIESLHPELKEIKLPWICVSDAESLRAWRSAVAEVIEKYGGVRVLSPIPLQPLELLGLLIGGKHRERE